MSEYGCFRCRWNAWCSQIAGGSTVQASRHQTTEQAVSGKHLGMELTAYFLRTGLLVERPALAGGNKTSLREAPRVDDALPVRPHEFRDGSGRYLLAPHLTPLADALIADAHLRSARCPTAPLFFRKQKLPPPPPPPPLTVANTAGG